MADTSIQNEAEAWVRDTWMFTQFGQPFHPEKLQLSTGGVFDFDAVSIDCKMAALISTSTATTARGKNAVGKLMKIRSDILFLMLASVERRLMIFTEIDMYEKCLLEARNGRFPSEIEFFHAELPKDLTVRLQEARKIASDEVSPRIKYIIQED